MRPTRKPTGLYLRFIEEHPNSPMVEQAEKARTAFAQATEVQLGGRLSA
jgi:hypothetical protein